MATSTPGVLRRLGEGAAAFLLGVIVVLVVLEGALRLVGWLHHHRASAGPGAGPSVLCVGDSYTVGMGAPSDMSYPAQLARLLQAAGHGQGAINAGRLTENSYQMLQALPAQLALYQPRVVILMIGRSNRWNAAGFPKAVPETARETPEGSAWTSLLWHFRIYRFVKLLALDLQEKASPEPLKTPDDPALLSDDPGIDSQSPNGAKSAWWLKAHDMLGRREYDKAIAFLKGIHAPAGEEAQRLLLLGIAYKDKFDAPMAQVCLLQAARLSPRDWRSHYHLARTYVAQQKWIPAVETYKKATVLSPQPALVFTDLMAVCPVADVPAALDDIVRRKPALRAVLAPLADLEKSARAIEEWIRHDVTEAVWMCRKKGAKVVLMDYPGGLIVAGKRRSTILRRLAQELGTPFVDNAEAFARLDNPRDHLVPDGHCNAKGYGVIARNAYEVVQPLLASVSQGKEPPSARRSPGP